jgi:hypothetical protein
MKEPSFDSTPQFAHFREVMRAVLSVPKQRIDELVQSAKENSPRVGNPDAPGKKPKRKHKLIARRP